MFFRPAIGSIFSSLGISDSMLNSGPTWRKSVSDPTTAPASATGIDSSSTRVRPISISSKVAWSRFWGWAM